jgi:hypothetical protein
MNDSSQGDATASGWCEDGAASSQGNWLGFLAVGGIFLVFALHAGWHVPGVNEPHYLSKAKHHWEADWAPRDFFLNSADSHQVFYLTVGWLARWQSLDGFAWTGRILTWLLLAITLWRLCRSLAIPDWAAPLAASLFVTLNSRAMLAGEWVVGGFEAKGLAYAAVFWALERWVRGKWNQALVAAGVATAMHALVGGWAAIALGFGWLALGRDRPRLATLVPGLISGALLAAPGIASGLALNWGADPKTVSLANQIYVFIRLRHHLLPWEFDRWAWPGALLLVAVWFLLGWRIRGGQSLARLRGFVNGSLAIAAAGLVLAVATRSNQELAARVMRYYWFRLADVAIPLGVAIYAVRLAVDRASAAQRRLSLLIALSLVAVASVGDDLYQNYLESQRPIADRYVVNEPWLDVCQWISQNTPRDALFLTPRLSATFKWRAGRSEVVNWKDIPQDAQSIVEWRRRLQNVHLDHRPERTSYWLDSLALATPERLSRLAEEYGADYVVTDSTPELALEKVYSNNAYAVYRLPAK